MKQERLNSEKKIKHDFFNVKLGTINKNNPSTVYVNGSVFISPLLNKENYDNDINEIKNNFNKIIKSELKISNLFDNKFICDFDVRTSGIKPNKKSFLSFQYHLKQNKNNIMKLDILKNNVNQMINTVLNELEKNILEHDFSLSKSKK